MLSLLSRTAPHSHALCHALTHCVTDFHVVGGFVFMQVVHTDTACTKIALQLCADVLYFHTVRTVLRRASCRQELSHNAGDRFPLTMGACHAAELRSRIPRHILTNRATFSRTVPHSHEPRHILTNRATFSRTALRSHAPRHILMHRATFSRTALRSHAPCHILTHRATFSRTVPCSHALCDGFSRCGRFCVHAGRTYRHRLHENRTTIVR